MKRKVNKRKKTRKKHTYTQKKTLSSKKNHFIWIIRAKIYSTYANVFIEYSRGNVVCCFFLLLSISIVFIIAFAEHFYFSLAPTSFIDAVSFCFASFSFLLLLVKGNKNKDRINKVVCADLLVFFSLRSLICCTLDLNITVMYGKRC